MRFKEKTKSDNNRRRAFTYLTEEKGLEPHVAAGILGNFMQESGHSLDIEAYNPDDMGSPSYGLAQWRGDRLNRLKKVAGKRASTLEGQLDYMMWEFNNTEKRAYKKLQQASTAEEAALAFSKYYERPHEDYAHNDKRAGYANQVYSTYAGTPEVVASEVVTEQERQDWNSYTPPTREEMPNYDLGIPPRPVQVPYLAPPQEEEAVAEETDNSEVIDQAVTQIDRRKADMATLQQLMKANEVQYIDPNQTEEQVQYMEEGGETDPPTEEYDFFNDPDKLFTEENKLAPLEEGETAVPVNEPLYRVQRKGREKKPINHRVAETTGVATRSMDRLKPVNTEVDTTLNYQDILNPIVITYDRGKEQLKEKVASKSEFLNPLGMEKIDPNTIQSEEEVRRIQGQLAEKGYDLGESGVDGKMGEKTLAAINKFNTKLTLDEELSIGNFKTPEQVQELQEFLITKGFDLNPNGKFKNDGVDGKLGEITKKALMQYNKKAFGGDQLPYKGVKDGEGYLGKCEEEQCSEYVQNEIFRNLSPDMSRTEWNRKTGLTGNAWEIGENILSAGGRKVAPEGVSAGDVVTIYTGGGSNYQEEADKHGTGTTHTAVIDQVNDDGSYYVLHNVHSQNFDGSYEGREFRDLVKPNGKMDGRFGTFQVKGIFRPKADAVGKATKPLRKDVGLTIDPDRAENLQSISSFRGNAAEKVQTYIEPLNNFKNKEKFSKIFELDESEYQSLAQLTVGIIGQESNFGTSPKALIKEPVAEVASFLGIKSDEASEGAGQLKYDTNFHSDLTEFGINSRNFDKDKNVPIASMYKLATDYKRFLKKGYSKKDALYRAAVVYNASLSGESGGKTREEWAQDYDVDYANKAITLASTLGVQGETKGYKTMIDELLLEDNVYKWNKKTFSGRNE